MYAVLRVFGGIQELNETSRKPNEMWIDEKGISWTYMQVGVCRICGAIIYAPVPMNMYVDMSKYPIFCEACTAGILKVIRPDLQGSVGYTNIDKEKEKKP
jgi:hypothetical protein